MSNYGMQNYIVRTMADGTSITSNATEEISSSYLISANTVEVGSFLEMFLRTERSVSGAVTYTVTVYINTSASLLGATLLATYTTDSTARSVTDMGRWLLVKSSTVTQLSMPDTQSSLQRYAIPLATFTEVNIDWTVDQYIIVALTNNGAGNTTLAKGMLILKY